MSPSKSNVDLEIINLGPSASGQIPLIKESAQLDPKLKSIKNTYGRPFDPIDLLRTLTFSVYNARCVSFKAMATVGLGFTISKIGAEEPYPEDESRSKYPYLYKTNERDESAVEVLGRSQQDKETIGDGFFEVGRTIGGEIETLYGVAGEGTWVEKAPKTKVGGYVQKLENRYQRFRRFGTKFEASRPAEYVRFKNPMIGSLWYGTPDYLPAVRAMALMRVADDFNYAFFRNGAVPSWAFVASGVDLDNKQKQKMQEFFSGQFGGADNWNKLLLLTFKNPEIKAEFQRITAKIEDMSFDKLFDKKTLEIVSAHGVPPRIVGIITAGALGGGGEYQAQLKTFKEVLIRPKQVLVEETLNNTIFAETGDRIDFNEIDITPIVAEREDDTEASLFEVSQGELDEAAKGAAIAKSLIAARDFMIKSGAFENDEI